MMRKVLLAAVLLAACDVVPAVEIGPEFDAQAIAFLDELQPRSIREKREYCGYFGLDEAGEFRATTPTAGWEEGCELSGRQQLHRVVASYHTHAAYDAQIDSEVPSTDDIESDVIQRTYGYLSTPGGRVWLVDWRTKTAMQLCGVGCVWKDPKYSESATDPIPERFTLSQIKRRQGG